MRDLQLELQSKSSPSSDVFIQILDLSISVKVFTNIIMKVLI